MLRKGGASDSIPALGLAGDMGFSGLQPLGGDSLRLRSSGHAMVLRVDPNNRLQLVDGRGTTSRVIAERGADVLVPIDSAWRAGASDATHVFTTRPLILGTVSLTPGMCTPWVQHTRRGTFLNLNRQTGQRGTLYDASQDVGRVGMQSAAAPGFVEELTHTVRALGPNRGVLK
ncbi:MAG: DUF2911 domain-containing protein [Gemmatimonadaceae bacterium]|nr:DUF2911 domain-containing protein [Gemmatimonadaceae bacterium]